MGLRFLPLYYFLRGCAPQKQTVESMGLRFLPLYYFLRGCAPQKQTFYIDTTSLNAASVVKVLGIYIQQNLKWDTQVKEMLKKCNGRLFMLRTLKRFNLPLCDLITIYTGYVRPILEYCAPVFHSNLTKKQTNNI